VWVCVRRALRPCFQVLSSGVVGAMKREGYNIPVPLAHICLYLASGALAFGSGFAAVR